MTEIILVIQSGESGPISLAGVSARGMKRTLEALQRGNPEILHVRDAIKGDDRIMRRLHLTMDKHYRARDWYEPAALRAIDATFTRHDYDLRTERQRISRIELAEILKRP